MPKTPQEEENGGVAGAAGFGDRGLHTVLYRWSLSPEAPEDSPGPICVRGDVRGSGGRSFRAPDLGMCEVVVSRSESRASAGRGRQGERFERSRLRQRQGLKRSENKCAKWAVSEEDRSEY